MSGTVAVVLAPPLDSYPPVRHLAAHELVRPCACGVDIVQRTGEDVVAVVAGHNAHPAHRAWRERRG
jgi:hypothetical protein